MKAPIRIGITLYLKDFDGLVQNMRDYPPLANAEFYLKGIDCGNFTVDSIDEVRSLAGHISGAAQKFRDAEEEYESWGRQRLKAVG